MRPAHKVRDGSELSSQLVEKWSIMLSLRVRVTARCSTMATVRGWQVR